MHSPQSLPLIRSSTRSEKFKGQRADLYSKAVL